MTTAARAPDSRNAVAGGAYALAAFGTWGLAPLYWRLVREVPSLELVAHRVLWSVPVLLWLVARRRRTREVAAALCDRAHRRILLATAVLIGGNWLLFVWAVQHEHVLEASLGYYVTPLLNVLLGTMVLRERLSRLQGVALALATAGVLWLAFTQGTPPWIALVLATTFAAYGLLRKQAGVDALVGLAAETWVLFPVALVAVVALLATGKAGFTARWSLAGLVVASGVVTALPLLWFTHAARRLRLATLGFFQFLAPTIHFGLAVFVFGEPFRAERAVAFTLIWAAVALYLVDAARRLRRQSVDARPS